MKKAFTGLLIVLLLHVALAAPAQQAYLSDIVVTNTRGHLLVYFTVNGCFTPDMNAAIDSGIETTFTFFVTLYERRSLLWDKNLADIEFRHTVKYDNLKGTYDITLSEENNKTVTVNNFEQAKKLMSEVVALEVVPMNRMKEGFLLSGQEMKVKPDFFIGAAANPFAEPMEMRIIRLEKKITAGAQFIQTQPVFDPDRFAEWMRLVRCRGLHTQCTILAGVLPVRSARALEYMQREVPGMRIQPEYLQRMRDSATPQEEGVRIAVEIITALREMEGVRGVHLMPVMWESITPRIVEEAGLMR